MLPERAEKMLIEYRRNVGRCASLEVAISELRDKIVQRKAAMISELAGPGSQRLDGMPQNPTPGNPTERAALLAASGYIPEDVALMEREVEEKEAEAGRLRISVRFVEAWLNGLTSRERWIIESQLIDGATYRELNFLYRKQFGEECSKDSLRRLKREAMKKIYEMAR